MPKAITIIVTVVLCAWWVHTTPAHAAFGDCSEPSYRVLFDPRLETMPFDCVERLRISVPTEAGSSEMAKVVRKWRKRVSRRAHEWALHYRYTVEGREFDAQTLDVRDNFTHLEAGDSLDIYYLPENLAISAPAWLVDEARRAVPA